MDPINSPPAGTARISQRAPKSCQRCAIKKMKCSKTVPCDPCIDNGIGDQCRREQVITTKHIRQAHRRNRRESMSNMTDSTQSKRSSKDTVSLHDQLPRFDEEVMFQKEYSRSVLPTTYSESHRHAYRKDPESGLHLDLQATQSAAPPEYHGRPVSIAPEGETSSYNEQADIENAANSLELLAWGRQRDTGLSPNSAMVLNVAARNADVLLPRQARLVLCYHRDWINWTHNTIHWPTLFAECQDYWLEGIVVEKAWLSVYYAALCAALIVMPPGQRAEIGLSQDITKQLYHHSIEALKAAEYAENHSRRVVQAICLITPCAHVFGGSNLFAVLLSSAIRIAQSLNMHRIGIDRDSNQDDESRLEREMQKGLWAYLCTQDWFNIPFANAHAISPAHCTTPLPLNCDGISGFSQSKDKFKALPMECPTQMTYMLNVFQVADICRSFFDRTAALTSDNYDDRTMRILYEHVLSADAQIKTVLKTCASYLRLKVEEPIGNNGVFSIQRTTFLICVHNKVLSVHRRFFLRSLADRWYTYTRVACLEAAKTILQEYQNPSCHQLARNVWQVVAHVIGACVVLLLAMIFSEEDYHDREAMRKLICDCVDLLSTSSNGTDMLQRGIRLIGIMLQHESEVQLGQRRRHIDTRQIASELQHGEQGHLTAQGDIFFEMAGALDLDSILRPFGETYDPYFSNQEEYN